MKKRKAKAKNKRVAKLHRQRIGRKKHRAPKVNKKKNKTLAIILGAGFSYNAGLPLAGKIIEYFDRDLREKLLCFSSSEWSWIDDKSEYEINQGKIRADHLAYSYILNRLKDYYIELKGSLSDYEDLFNFILKKCEDREFVAQIWSEAKLQLESDYPDIQVEYLFPFSAPNGKHLIEIFNYLITDLLVKDLSKINEISYYKNFIKLISKYKYIKIFTLNHDVLLETLLAANKMIFSKGFYRKNSNIAYEGNLMPTFQYTFKNCPIQIHKLHGSIDCSKYIHGKEIGSGFYPNKEYTYFIPDGYYEKHNSIRINPCTQKVVQRFNYDIIPQFITGKEKMSVIKGDRMYSFLYSKYKQDISKADKVLISGYSFSDDHINKELKKVKVSVVNQNPGTQYPFGNKNENIRSFEDIKGI